MSTVVYSLTFDLKAVQVLEFDGDDEYRSVSGALRTFHSGGQLTGWVPPLLCLSEGSAQRDPTPFRATVDLPASLVIERDFLVRHDLGRTPGLTVAPLRNEGLVLGLVRGVEVAIREESSSIPPGFLKPLLVDFVGDVPLEQLFAVRRPGRWAPVGLFVAVEDNRVPELLQVLRSTPANGLRVDVAWTSSDGPRPVPFT